MSDGREAAFGGRSADRQRHRKKKAFDEGGPVWPPGSNAKDGRTSPSKKHLIEAVPFGRLDQMLRTIFKIVFAKINNEIARRCLAIWQLRWAVFIVVVVADCRQR